MDIQPHIEAFIRYSDGLGRSAQTIERYRTSLGHFRRYLDEFGVTGDLTALTPQVMAGFQGWLYQARSRYRRPYMLKSQIGVLNNVQVFGQLPDEATGRLLNNPAEAIRLPKDPPRRLPGTILTPAEMKSSWPSRTRLPCLASGTGRFTKSSTRPDSASPKRSICESRTSVRIRGRSSFMPARAARTALSRSASPLAVTWPNTRKTSGLSCFAAWRLYARTLPTPFSSTVLDIPSLNPASRKSSPSTRPRAGIKKHITVHTFRHTLATEMLRHGADLRQIQELLGHANLRTTQIYTHIVKGELKRVQEQCHPREQTALPEGFVKYRGRKYLTDEDRKQR